MSQVTIRILRGRKTGMSRWFVEVEQFTGRELLPEHSATKKKAIEVAQVWAAANGVKNNTIYIIPTKD